MSIVVLGILIALGLESWRETIERNELIEHSKAAMRAEIDANKQQIEGVLADFERARPTVEALAASLDESIRGRNSASATVPTNKRQELRLPLPTLTSGAWQAAVATQAIGHMNYSDAQRWSGIYALQDHVQRFENEWIPFYGRLATITSPTAESDLQWLKQQRALADEIRLRMTVMQMLWRGLLERYEAALDDGRAHDQHG